MLNNNKTFDRIGTFLLYLLVDRDRSYKKQKAGRKLLAFYRCAPNWTKCPIGNVIQLLLISLGFLVYLRQTFFFWNVICKNWKVLQKVLVKQRTVSGIRITVSNILLSTSWFVTTNVLAPLVITSWILLTVFSTILGLSLYL